MGQLAYDLKKVQQIEQLKEQRDELLDALRDLLDEYEMVEKRGTDECVVSKAKAAIEKSKSK